MIGRLAVQKTASFCSISSGMLGSVLANAKLEELGWTLFWSRYLELQR